MREILFRGKRNGYAEQRDRDWLEGSLFVGDNGGYEICYGTPRIRITYSVIPVTVGQFTGLTDKNGKKIFEGDIVDILTENEEIGVVAYEDGGFLVNADGFCVDFHTNIKGTDLEVIGNIHDNPELLGAQS